MTILLEQSPHFTLVYDASHACLYATWHGQHGGTITRASYELIFQFVRITHSTKLLNDGLLDQNGWQEITTWLAHNYFHRLANEGVVAVGWVLPRNTEALCATHQLLALIKQPVIDTFDDSEAAYNWLHQWPKVCKEGELHPSS